MNKETRIYKGNEDTELRAHTDKESGKRYIEFYASVFNQESRLLFENDTLFREVISPNAFDEALASKDLDVLATYNHDNTRMLGRSNVMSGANTLELTPTERGLKSRVEIPNTATGNEVFELIERGDLDEASFVFTVDEEGQDWDFTEEPALRTINNVRGLYDVSVVHKGAYAGGEVAVSARAAYDEAKFEHDAPTEEELKQAKDNYERKVNNNIDEMTIKLHTLKGNK
jgi:HK97 family phage prohead protease